tara:strand:+ start:6965 stop:7450 length:486 start_codon:yes stop_codon:yes gene_type:complete
VPIQPSKLEQREKSSDTFRKYLSRKGLRLTNQRKAIFEAVFNNLEHFTAEELLDYSRKIDVSVSRATVYRTLPLLIEGGLVREVDIGSDYKFYQTSPGEKRQQAQVICLDCEKISEIEAPFMEWYSRSVAQKVGLEPVHQRLQVHAQCMIFKEEGLCDNHR